MVEEDGTATTLRLVVADGFTDFTRTQHEILEILAAQVEEICISLPLEGKGEGSPRPDLFDKPRRTLAELRRRHGAVTVEEVPRPFSPVWPALDHLERTLFGNPRHARPAPDTSGLEILAAASPAGELEMIAARIKRLLVEGDAGYGPVRPGEIAVVFRHPQDASGLAGEVLAAYGIPVAWELGVPLQHQPAIMALERLLRLHVEDWPLAALLAVLGSNYFARLAGMAGGRGPPGDRPGMRRLQVPRGRRALLGRLQAAAGDSPPDAWVAAAVLGRLAAVLDELPQRAGLAAWGQAWQRLAEQTGLLEVMQPGRVGRVERDPPGTGQTLLWWDSLHSSHPTRWAYPAFDRPGRLGIFAEGLGESADLDRWLGQPAAELDAGQALATLADILASQRLKPCGDEEGRVRVVSAASVRGLAVHYLFLAGLGERSFPSPQREDRLYSEAEYQRLIDAGLPLSARAQRNGDEMLLFYRGRHPRDPTAVPQLSGPGPAGTAALAEPLPRRGRTGLRSGADRADGAEPTQPGAGRRRAFFDRRVSRQGGGRRLGGRHRAVGRALARAEGGGRKGEGKSRGGGEYLGRAGTCRVAAGPPALTPCPSPGGEGET